MTFSQWLETLTVGETVLICWLIAVAVTMLIGFFAEPLGLVGADPAEADDLDSDLGR